MAVSSYIFSFRMKNFLIKAISFSLLFILIDIVVGQIFDRFYFKVKSGNIYKSNYSLTDCNEDILIMGASEVSHSFISRQIEDSLGLTCYNLGMDAQNIYYQYAMLEQIVKRYTPKIIVISTYIIEEDEVTVNTLFPYFSKNKDIAAIVNDIAPKERIKLISKIYTYNSQILKILKGLIIPEPPTNGYMPINTTGMAMKLDTIPFTASTSARTLRYFEKYLKLALQAGSMVVVVATPKYLYELNNEFPIDLNDGIYYNNVLHLVYENDTAFVNHPEYFRDKINLNHTGAQIFTARLISDLEESGLAETISVSDPK